MTRYSITLYHDEPGEAAANHLGYPEYFKTAGTAVSKARELLDDYWQMAQVDRGYLIEADHPNRPEQFDMDLSFESILVDRSVLK